MTYNELLEILLCDNVYEILKEREVELFRLIPELRCCKGFNQNNKWHIYDVYEHILHVLLGVESNMCLRLSALFHDIGKPSTYTEDNLGIGHFYNHWNESIKIFKKYQDKFNLSNEDICLIINLIFYHDINIDKMMDEDICKMIYDIGISNMKLLFSLKRADLLAQSSEFHGLLLKINDQEHRLIKSRRIKD